MLPTSGLSFKHPLRKVIKNLLTGTNFITQYGEKHMDLKRQDTHVGLVAIARSTFNIELASRLFRQVHSNLQKAGFSISGPPVKSPCENATGNAADFKSVDFGGSKMITRVNLRRRSWALSELFPALTAAGKMNPGKSSNIIRVNRTRNRWAKALPGSGGKSGKIP